jgi:hypothetical protein
MGYLIHTLDILRAAAMRCFGVVEPLDALVGLQADG